MFKLWLQYWLISSPRVFTSVSGSKLSSLHWGSRTKRRWSLAWVLCLHLFNPLCLCWNRWGWPQSTADRDVLSSLLASAPLCFLLLFGVEPLGSLGGRLYAANWFCVSLKMLLCSSHNWAMVLLNRVLDPKVFSVSTLRGLLHYLLVPRFADKNLCQSDSCSFAAKLLFSLIAF